MMGLYNVYNNGLEYKFKELQNIIKLNSWLWKRIWRSGHETQQSTAFLQKFIFCYFTRSFIQIFCFFKKINGINYGKF